MTPVLISDSSVTIDTLIFSKKQDVVGGALREEELIWIDIGKWLKSLKVV